MAGTPPPSGKNPAQLQKSLSRRVSFNEATLSKRPSKPHLRPPPSYADDNSSLDMEAQPSSGRPRRKCSSKCNSCCAWTSVIVGILLILLLSAGGAYFAFLQSNLPEVHLHRLDINLLNVTNTKSDTLLTSDFEVRVNATNKNKYIQLSYGGSKASLSSVGIELGTMNLPPFQQPSETSSDLRIRVQRKNQPVEEAAAKDLQDNSKSHMLVINVEVKGHIGFLVKGNKMNGFPFRILCTGIDQSEIDNGHAPKCNVRMSLY